MAPWRINLHVVVNLALTQSLIKALTEGQVVLLLSTFNELLDLPSARSLRSLVLVLAESLSWWLCLRVLLCRLTAAASTKQASEGTTSYMTLQQNMYKSLKTFFKKIGNISSFK